MSSVRLENHSADWGTVFIQHDDEEVAFPYHIPTREIFNHDPELLVRIKCIGLTCLTPLASLIRSVYWLSQSIFLILTEVYHYLDGQAISDDAQGIIEESAYDTVRALGYGALMTGSAFMGIFDPNQGRYYYGRLERELNRHWDGPHRDKFYLAICFQRIFVIPEDDEELTEVEDRLTKYLDRIDEIRAAFWSCDVEQLMVGLRLMPAKQ